MLRKSGCVHDEERRVFRRAGRVLMTCNNKLYYLLGSGMHANPMMYTVPSMFSFPNADNPA